MQEIIAAWQKYLNSVSDWEDLVKGVAPKQTGCGPVYELPNPIDRPNESFAICDMRDVSYTQPHYHAHGEMEIYFVLAGTGVVVRGTEEITVTKGSIVVTSSGVTHYVVHQKNLVIACVNIPSFNPDNEINVYETNEEVQFDKEQFEKIISIKS